VFPPRGPLAVLLTHHAAQIQALNIDRPVQITGYWSQRADQLVFWLEPFATTRKLLLLYYVWLAGLSQAVNVHFAQQAAVHIFLHIVRSIFTPYNRDMYCTLMLLLEISTCKTDFKTH
jgi:hypothetical protein